MHHMHAQLKVHICTPYTHTCTTKHMCTTKYHQNIRYTQLAFPLYSMKHQVQMRDLCWISCFWCFSLCFSLFRWMLFTKTAAFHKNCHFSWKLQRFSLWAFGLSPSIGLSFERPKIELDLKIHLIICRNYFCCGSCSKFQIQNMIMSSRSERHT